MRPFTTVPVRLLVQPTTTVPVLHASLRKINRPPFSADDAVIKIIWTNLLTNTYVCMHLQLVHLENVEIF